MNQNHTSHSRSPSEPVLRAGAGSSEPLLDVLEPLVKFGLIGLFLIGGFIGMLESGYVPGIRWTYDYYQLGNSKVIVSAVYITPVGFRQGRNIERTPVALLPLKDEERPSNAIRHWFKTRFEPMEPQAPPERNRRSDTSYIAQHSSLVSLSSFQPNPRIQASPPESAFLR